MTKKNDIRTVLRNAQHAVKTELLTSPERDLDVGVLVGYVDVYIKLYNGLKRNLVIKDECDGIYNALVLWGTNLRDMQASDGNVSIASFKTANIAEMITNIESLLYKAKDKLEDKDLDPTSRREILAVFNDAIFYVMSNSGGIPIKKEE